MIQAKKFLKGDWLKREVFQPNLKYLRQGISFPQQPTRSCFDFENMAERFCEWAWMPFTLIPSQCRGPHVAVKSSAYPSGFRCIIYCLAGVNGQWERTHTYVRVNCQILTRGNQNIWMVSSVFTSVVFCWKHGGKVSWMSVNAVYLNSVAMSTFRRWKSVDESGSRWRY